MPPASLRFAPFELQPAQRRLLREGVPVLLRARAFDLLVVLVERAGSLVTKGELLDLVWPGLVVEENNIAAQVAALRKTLGGDFIATVAGRGYRFTAEVHQSMTSGPAVAVEASTAAPAGRGRRGRAGRVAAGRRQRAEQPRRDADRLGRHEEALALVATLLARSDGIASAVGAHNRIRRLDAIVLPARTRPAW